MDIVCDKKHGIWLTANETKLQVQVHEQGGFLYVMKGAETPSRILKSSL